MRSKLFTTFLALVIVGPFSYFTFTEATQIKQRLEEQQLRINSLRVESAKLDTSIVETAKVRDQAARHVGQLQQQTADASSERKKLEAELGSE